MIDADGLADRVHLAQALNDLADQYSDEADHWHPGRGYEHCTVTAVYLRDLALGVLRNTIDPEDALAIRNRKQRELAFTITPARLLITATWKKP